MGLRRDGSTRRGIIAAIAGGAAASGSPAAAALPPAPPGRIWICIPIEAYQALVALGRFEASR